MNKLVHLLFWTLVICQFLDGGLTYFAVSHWGLWVEGNPLIVYMMETFGIFGGIFIAKFIAVVLLLWWATKVFGKVESYGKCVSISLFVVTSIYVLVVATWIDVFYRFYF